MLSEKLRKKITEECGGVLGSISEALADESKLPCAPLSRTADRK